MHTIKIHLNRFFVAILMIALVMMMAGTPKSAAQAPIPGCGERGAVNPNCETQQSGTVDAQMGTFFTKAYSGTLNGGYVAHGVGMRNTGHGNIAVSDIPAGSTVSKAYLFWALIAPSTMPGYTFNKGFLNGVAISGSLVGKGADPYWGSDPIWSYRADVTSKMIKGGNGVYHLTGFASGTTDGSDPWSIGSSEPMLDGASLVILFKNSSYPKTTFQIFNGAATTFTNTELHLNIPGFNAVAPTGFVNTTFIGADGQNNVGGSVSTFFTAQLPSVLWEGNDPNGAPSNYSNGNLWDTMTVDLHSMIDPPEPDFWFTTTASSDAITWVAQVASYSSGNQDSDGDGLSDGAELNGYYGPLGYFIGLPGMGADPLHKDLFVEADYMTGHLPPGVAYLDDIVNVFNNAPVANPDGTTGIHIHIDTGGTTNSGYDATYDLGGGNEIADITNLGSDTPNCASYDWKAFQDLKDANFNSDRAAAFHYMIFADHLAPCFGTVSGISRNGSTDAAFIKGATDFIVSLGGWANGGSNYEREGTFIHELGHNLGLRHGGNDHVNYKPNYLSVMNYFFQTTGVYRNGSWYNFDYSRFALPSLNESSLNEINGLGPLAATYGTEWYCPNGSTNINYSAGSNIDWNCNSDGGIQKSVKVNINHDSSTYPNYTPIYSTLGTQNNWANITFKGGGAIGAGAKAAGLASSLGTTYWVNELTYEMAQKLGVAK